MQVFITHSLAPSSLLLAHSKQLAALVPKFVCDLGCLMLVGPSSSAVLRRDVYLISFISAFLPHAYRTVSALSRHASHPSPDTLLAVIQSASTLAINMTTFLFHLATGYSVWGCLRLAHTLVGTCGIAICMVHRLSSEWGSAADYPPLRGSFEGGLFVYTAFVGTSAWISPARRLAVHGKLTSMFPEGWLPLSELKRDELKALLKDETGSGHLIDWTPVASWQQPAYRSQQPSSHSQCAPWTAHERYELEPCGASTLGSNSELGELSAAVDGTAVSLEPQAEEGLPLERVRTYSTAYYERKLALLRTLEACGISFSDTSTSPRLGVGYGYE